MLDYGVDANLVDFYGKTALMLACTEGYLELVKLLSVGFNYKFSFSFLFELLPMSYLAYKYETDFENHDSLSLSLSLWILHYMNSQITSSLPNFCIYLILGEFRSSKLEHTRTINNNQQTN